MQHEWYYGLKNYRKCIVSNIDGVRYFTTNLIETHFPEGRNIDDIFYDHLYNRQTKYVEILFSGGADSILVLNSCLRNKIPTKVITMNILASDITINLRDMYYAEKFCRENNIQQSIIDFDASEFYNSGRYLEYLNTYNIIEPHVASHFWLIERCDSFPIMCGDWPWAQCNVKDRVLSPVRLDYSCYDRFMKDNNIDGIGNMIGYSLESTCYFIQKQIEHYNHKEMTPYNMAKLKQNMYGLNEARLRSYGWEHCPTDLIDMNKIKIDTINAIGLTKHEIVWGDKIRSILNTDKNSNDKF